MTPSLEKGFTLIELMVALLIFGMLAAAGVTLLSFATRAEDIAGKRDKDTAKIRNLSAVLVQDMAMILPRQSRSTANIFTPAFVLNEQGAILSYARGGGQTQVANGKGSLNHIIWAVEDKTLVRRIYPGPDVMGDPVSVTMIANVDQVSIRVRDKGQWLEGWTSADMAALPSAVELTIDPAKGEPIIISAMVGAGQ